LQIFLKKIVYLVCNNKFGHHMKWWLNYKGQGLWLRRSKFKFQFGHVMSMMSSWKFSIGSIVNSKKILSKHWNQKLKFWICPCNSILKYIFLKYIIIKNWKNKLVLPHQLIVSMISTKTYMYTSSKNSMKTDISRHSIKIEFVKFLA
jgi:hypothetical protein